MCNIAWKQMLESVLQNQNCEKPVKVWYILSDRWSFVNLWLGFVLIPFIFIGSATLSQDIIILLESNTILWNLEIPSHVQFTYLELVMTVSVSSNVMQQNLAFRVMIQCSVQFQKWQLSQWGYTGLYVNRRI